MAHPDSHGRVALSPATRAKLRALVRQHGERRVADGLHINVQTLARGVAGFLLYRSFAALVERGVVELEFSISGPNEDGAA